MDIQFDYIIPVPLKDLYTAGSVWGQQKIFSVNNYYLVRAASGKGKSTLLSYIYGLRNDFDGKLILGSEDASGYTLNQWAELRRSKVALVFQDLRLFEELSALENIMVKFQLEPSVDMDELMKMTETLKINHLLTRKVKYLSMGQQQRVAIIRALVQPFEWLLMDEPFSHLDRENIAIAEDLIRSCCSKNNAGLILTSLGETYGLAYNETIVV